MRLLNIILAGLVGALAVSIAGCGGSGSGADSGDNTPAPAPPPPAPPPTYSIGGSISGLNGTVVLQNNGSDNLTANTNGPFAFATALNSGASYVVTVQTQPAGQNCLVTNGAGTLASAAVSSVLVTCAVLPLELTSSTPADGATDVSTTGAIELQFSAPLAATPDPILSLALRSTYGNQSASIPFTGVVTGAGVSLTPTVPLPLLRQHQLIIGDDLRGTAGESPASPVTLSFTTRDGQWRTASMIEGSGATETYNPRIVIDGAGHLHAAWTQFDGLRFNLWASRYAAGGWETPQLLETDDSADATVVDLAVDGEGNVIAVWSQGLIDSIWANRYQAGIGWGVAELLESGAGAAHNVRVSASVRGDAIAVWQQYGDIWAARYVSGDGWTSPVQLEQGAPASIDPQIAMDREGNALAVWMQYENQRYDIWASRFTESGGWQSPTLVDISNDGSASQPKVVLDEAGDALVVWQQSNGVQTDIWARRADARRGWQSATPLETHDADDAVDPQVAVDAAGNAIVVWSQYDGEDWNIWSNRYEQSVGWGAAVLIDAQTEGDARSPRVVVDAAGHVTALWSQDSPDYGVHANRYIPGRGWGAAVPANPGFAGIFTTQPWLVVDDSGYATAVWTQAPAIGSYGIWFNRFD